MLEVQAGRPASGEIIHPDIVEIRSFPTVEATASATARFILDSVRTNPSAVITYATGETMIPVYSLLSVARDYQKVDFSGTLAFHLDERYPLLSRADSSGFAQFIASRVVTPLGIPWERAMLWDGTVSDPVAESNRYNALLARHPVDLSIIGIGTNGHIAFVEPGTQFELECHWVQHLSDETLQRDRVERGEIVPDGALTQGVANILRAKNIILTAYGKAKGDALRDALYGPITPDKPASALRLAGKNVHIYVDAKAAEAINAPVV